MVDGEGEAEGGAGKEVVVDLEAEFGGEGL